MQDIKIICLIPTRNNESHIERCLVSASLWADYIIVCDQMSTDSTREICHKFQKVTLIENNSLEYNESRRQKLLINEARKIDGQRLLITLDADEILTPNVLYSLEWRSMLELERGVIIKFQWANFRPDFMTMWLGYHFPWGYMDDGYEHTENKSIHSGRIPLPEGNRVHVMNDVKVIHFQYTDWEKMLSKHRFYQCYELIHFPEKKAITLFRQYHHMYAIPKENNIPIPIEWVEEYKKHGVDITVNYPENNNWFDEQVLNFIEKYGALKFKKLNIWEVNWVQKAKVAQKSNVFKFNDPRNLIDKIIHWWLLKTQDKIKYRTYRRIDRIIEWLFNY